MKIKLRGFNTSDADLLVDYLNDTKVTQYITAAIPHPYTNDDAMSWIEHGKKSDYIKAIEFDGVLVGCISAKRGEFEYSRGAELGYWIATEFWNQGIATQAIQEFSQQLFQTTNIVRLFVSVVAINHGSIKVLTKNGYELEGTLRKASYKNGRHYDEHILAKVSC